MCNQSCIHFIRNHLSAMEVQGKSVIEVGSYDFNGSVRGAVTALGPSRYLGVDMQMGPGVDEACDALDLVKRFGNDSFDVLLSTEVLEHVADWRKVCGNFKRIIRPGGILLVTTRSIGFPYHGYPFDFWRYEVSDMQSIFSDFHVEAVEKDEESPGVYIKARKPSIHVENDLADYALFSILKGKRVARFTATDVLAYKAIYKARILLSPVLPTSWKSFLKKFVKQA